MTYYETAGSVRGSCGHRHRSEDTARRCLRHDQEGCAQQGGYSDRRVVQQPGDYDCPSDGELEDETAAEIEAAEAERRAERQRDDEAAWYAPVAVAHRGG